jgi:hypothetical protein
MPIRSRPPRLFTVPDWASGQVLYLSWLRDHAAAALADGRPTLVVAPTRGDAYFLKAAALDAGLPLFGLHFLTPLEVRDRLRGVFSFSRALPLREHLRLFLAVAAEGADGPAAKTAAAAPDHLLKAIDLLGAGGWSFREAGPASLRGIVREFERTLRRCDFELIHDTDRALLAAAPGQPAVFASVFITGFDGAHWPLWPLLAATAQAAEHVTVGLRSPRAEAQDLDATWIGTWEQEFGASDPLPYAEAARPFEDALRIPDSPTEIAQRATHPLRTIEFLVGQNTAGQARAIVQKALHFLADPACHRLGILFPGQGALVRLVAELLAALEIPHNDGLAHRLPGPFETPDWPAWLELQETPRLPALLRFLHTFPRVENLFEGLAASRVEDILRRANKELLIDDLAVLAEWLARDQRWPGAEVVARSLRNLPQLPAEATFTDFLTAASVAFRDLGWTARAVELARVAGDWAARFDCPLSRHNFLQWLAEILVTTGTGRAVIGNHPYARTQLVNYANAETQSWTHLIAAGLNEGQWPPSFEESGWLGENEIDALNRRVGGLNRRATVEGSQGEGHATVEAGRTLCLGPVQRRALVQRQFLGTVESVSVAVAATAQLFDEAKPDRQLNPSDFFTRLFFCARGKALSQATMGALREKTEHWVETGNLWPASAPEQTAVTQTRRAFDARRDVSKPFGEYEFALRHPLARPPRLAATAWESALRAPALVWMQHFLGISAREADQDSSPWSLAIGQWSHGWLRAIAPAGERNAFAPLPPPEEIVRRVQESAEAFYTRASDVLKSCERVEPDWWRSLWQQALQVAMALVRRVAEVTGPTHLATEWNFADVTLGSGLHVHGRPDLILADGPVATAAPWIVDYKTGHKKSLHPTIRMPGDRVGAVMKRLREGDGLQLALYALALRQLGAASFRVSLLTPELTLEEPQLTEADLPANDPLWQGLSAMQESGVFGMRGELRSDFAFNDVYPLATLAIDPVVLEEKWARTHPDLAADEEEPA